uniref:Uncharacterized protein n=1 Tax=Takifugu rubripes TaxID=31033 RepID=A0A3B5KCV3_TAKRU
SAGDGGAKVCSPSLSEESAFDGNGRIEPDKAGPGGSRGFAPELTSGQTQLVGYLGQQPLQKQANKRRYLSLRKERVSPSLGIRFLD